MVREAAVRHDKVSGSVLIEVTENTSLIGFIADLFRKGWVISKAFAQKRIKGNKHYAMVRFVFTKQSNLALAERTALRQALYIMCIATTWRIRAFANPNGISVNLEVRNPLLRPDGSPVTQWLKDEGGKRIGEAPVMLSPKFYLRFDGALISLVEPPQPKCKDCPLWSKIRGDFFALGCTMYLWKNTKTK